MAQKMNVSELWPLKILFGTCNVSFIFFQLFRVGTSYMSLFEAYFHVCAQIRGYR